MQFLLRHELGGWSDLSTSNREGLLCYQKDDVFIITKVRAVQSMMTADYAVATYFKRLSEEVDIEEVHECLWETSLGHWRVFTCDISCPVSKYTVFACAVIDGVLYTIDAILPVIKDYMIFTKEFPNLVEVIEFNKLVKETASLVVGNAVVTVSGNSDVCLRSADNDVLIFVGRNKYFTVTSNIGMKSSVLEEAKGDFTLLMIKEGKNATRYSVNKEGEQCGTLELSLLPVPGGSIEILGYWLKGTESTMAENLTIEIKEVPMPCGKSGK